MRRASARPPEGRTEEVDAVPTALLENALGVAERTEAFDLMVGAHTACPDAAERQVVRRDVHDRSIDGDIAGCSMAQHAAPLVTVATEL